MKKKRSRKQWLVRLNGLLRQIVLLRDGHRCVRCGTRKGKLEVSHIKPKGAWPHLRYELKNVVLHCYRCHMHFWHSDPTDAAAWFIETYGEERLLELRAMKGTRLIPSNFQDIEDRLRQRLETYHS